MLVDKFVLQNDIVSSSKVQVALSLAALNNVGSSILVISYYTRWNLGQLCGLVHYLWLCVKVNNGFCISKYLRLQLLTYTITSSHWLEKRHKIL